MPSKLTGNLNPDVSQIKIALRGKITQPSVEKSVCSSLVLPFTATEKNMRLSVAKLVRNGGFVRLKG